MVIVEHLESFNSKFGSVNQNLYVLEVIRECASNYGGEFMSIKMYPGMNDSISVLGFDVHVLISQKYISLRQDMP